MNAVQTPRSAQAYRKYGWLAIGLSLAQLASPSVRAATPSFTPEWVRSISTMSPNQSFLDHWSDIDPVSGALLLDSKTSAEMQIRFQDISRTHRMKESYGLSSIQDERSYHGQAEEFSRHLFRLILNYQMQSRLKKAEKNSSELRTFNRLQKVTEKMTVQVDDGFRFGTKTDLPGQKGRLWMTTPYVNGSLDIDFGAPWEDPSEANLKTLDPGDRARDRYRLSLSRSLPVWELRSGVSYGFSSTVMTASLSKDLISGLSCQLLTRRGLDTGLSGFGGNEEAVKVLYRLQF